MLIFDLESDGFLDVMSVIHTMHIYDTERERFLRFNEGRFADGSPAPRDGCLQESYGLLQEADAICGHNIIGFDIPAIKKIEPSFNPRGAVHDTMIYSRYLYPNMSEIDAKASREGRRPSDFGKLTGSHNLKSWGIRLGQHKGDYNGTFEHFDQDMEEYAVQDVVVTKALMELLGPKVVGFEAALKLEHDTARVIAWQERHGFKFNMEKASDLERVLRGRKAELEDHLRSIFPPWEEPIRKGGIPFIFYPKRDNAKLGYKAGVGVPKTKIVSFNPASRDHIANRLTSLYGWVPVEKTEGGKPKVDETTLAGLDFPEGKMLVEYLTVDKRLGVLAEGKQNWMKKVGPDGRIHAFVNSQGAVTRRMTHSFHMAQVPASHSPYGKECRELFEVAGGKRLIGADAAGLELRMLAHYMARFDKGSYVNTVVNGSSKDGTDVHTMNQKFIGLNSRDAAKTWIYAYLYGAGNQKLGTVIYDDFTDEKRTKFHAKYPAGDQRDKALARLGGRARKAIEQGLPALGALQERVKELSKKKYLKTVDGGRLRVRSAHAALNTLLQGGGAVVMKKSLVMLVEALIADGFIPNDVTGQLVRNGEVLGFVVNVHDEWQIEADAHLAEYVGQLSCDAIRLAGEAFELRCPLAGEFGVGSNWAETH